MRWSRRWRRARERLWLRRRSSLQRRRWRRASHRRDAECAEKTLGTSSRSLRTFPRQIANGSARSQEPRATSQQLTTNDQQPTTAPPAKLTRNYVETWRHCHRQWGAHALWTLLREDQRLHGAGTGRGGGEGCD